MIELGKSTNTESTEDAENKRRRKKEKGLVVIALLADRKGNKEPVAGWRKRARGKRSVGARRIFETIEIEDEFAGLVEAICGEAGVKETAGAVSGRGAGGVAEDKEKLGDRGIFQDRLEVKCFSGENEFGSARDGLIVARADERGERDGFGRGVGNPFGGDAIGGVRRIQLESVESDDARRMGILDAQREPGFATDDVHVERADGEMRRNFVIVGFSAERLLLGVRARHEKVRRESTGRGVESDGFAFEMKYREMSGAACSEMDLVISGRPKRIVSRLEPFEAGEGEPAIGLQQVCNILRSPCCEVFLPGRVLPENRNGKKSAERRAEDSPCREVSNAHGRL
jgi:hypothetical protein